MRTAEALVQLRVGRQHRRLLLHHLPQDRPRDADPARLPDDIELGAHSRRLRRAGLRVEQQDDATVGAEHLTRLVEDAVEQAVELDLLGDRLVELVGDAQLLVVVLELLEVVDLLRLQEEPIAGLAQALPHGRLEALLDDRHLALQPLLAAVLGAIGDHRRADRDLVAIPNGPLSSTTSPLSTVPFREPAS